MKRWIPCCVCVLSLAACVVTRERQPAPIPVGSPVVGRAEAAWRVLAGDEVVGFAMRYHPMDSERLAPQEAGHGPWYAVQNRWNQELGMIDELGRAWRYRPHRNGPQWLGSGTIEEGVQKVLELNGALVLEEIPLDEL